jgi:hypothetical protein
MSDPITRNLSTDQCTMYHIGENDLSCHYVLHGAGFRCLGIAKESHVDSWLYKNVESMAQTHSLKRGSQ